MKTRTSIRKECERQMAPFVDRQAVVKLQIEEANMEIEALSKKIHALYAENRGLENSIEKIYEDGYAQMADITKQEN